LVEIQPFGRDAMTIIEAMQLGDNSLRISNGGSKWLVYDKEHGWSVYERGYGKKKTTIVYRGSQEIAVKFLLEE